MAPCTGTLIRHLDGSHECDLDTTSGCAHEPLAHDWTLACTDLGCDCVRTALLAA